MNERAAEAMRCDCARRMLHRIPEILEREQVSIRQAARQMGVTVRNAKSQMQRQYDLSLGELDAWSKAIGVPVTELLAVSFDKKRCAACHRAQLVQIMKTVRTLEQKRLSQAAQVLIARLKEQLVDLMPELDTVRGWPIVGQQRTESELGAVAARNLASEFSETLSAIDRLRSADREIA